LLFVVIIYIIYIILLPEWKITRSYSG